MKKEDFRTALLEIFRSTEYSGAGIIEITSGDLHRRVGGYPGPNHRMPVCCDVMYEEFREGDAILAAPPKGKGASLRIRYRLPRNRPVQYTVH